MNDTENRLRDYLHAEANTVPGSAHGPGLELDTTGTSTRRRWVPMALAAAGIAAVLTMAVPFLHGLTNHQPAVAGLPTTGEVPAGEPLVPYAVTVENNPGNPLDTWWSVIHDGSQAVKNPGVKGRVRARVDGGWLVETGYPDPKKSQAAVVSPDGKVRSLGPLGGMDPVVSPDGRQIAVPLSTYGSKNNRVVVVDVKTGKEVSSLSVAIPNLELIGWNKDGVWMNEHTPNARPISVWQPGSTDVRTTGKIDSFLTVARTSNTIVQLDNKGGNKWCATAATLGAKGLEPKRDYCFDTATVESNVVAPYVALSPDGATMALNTGVAVDIATGKTTKLNLPASTRLAGSGVFEDADTVILVDDAQPTQKVFRCGVDSGDCKQLAISKADESIALVNP